MRDPQSFFPALARHAAILLEEGRNEEAQALVGELFAHIDSGERLAYPPPPHLLVPLAALGGRDRLLEMMRPTPPSPWKDAAIAILDTEFAPAAEIFAERGAPADEAFLRLRAAQKLIEAGRRAEADVQLQRALAFYRSVGATRYVREAEALLAESA